MTRVRPPGREPREESTPVPLRGATALQRLLAELAYVLMPRGITPKRFSELARYAFARVAADVSKRRNGRVNHSRVAAQTGLSRSNVKHLLNRNNLDTLRADRTPVTRVVMGWRRDRKFLKTDGKPKTLTIRGSSDSFSTLVRKYGGDIPPRAVLEEMLRIGAVIKGVDSVKLRSSFDPDRHRDLRFLSLVLPTLIDGIRVASKTGSKGASSSICRLAIPVDGKSDLAFVRERCASSTRAMLDGLGEALGLKVRLAKRNRSSDWSSAITVLFAEGPTENPRGIGIRTPRT